MDKKAANYWKLHIVAIPDSPFLKAMLAESIAPVFTAPLKHKISRSKRAIFRRLPSDFRSKRLAELLWIQEGCFERSIRAIAEYHGMQI